MFKKTLILLGIVCALNLGVVRAASNIVVGESNVLSVDDSGNGNLLVAQKVTLSQAATLQSLSFYVSVASGRLQLGLYNSVGGNPQTLLASTPVFTPVVGWNTVSVSPILLSPGDYWLVYLPESNSLGFKLANSGSAKYYSTPFGSMPSPFSSSANSIASHWSFYATLTLGTANTPTLTATPTNTSTPANTLTPTPTPQLGSGPVFPLKASANGRYLVDQNDVPFLMVGDSPQAMIADLSEADADYFLANRKAAGFNTVWVNLLCNTYTGCRSDGNTYDGIPPFTTPGDLSTPNEAYFTRADHMIQLAAKYGLLVILDPIETGGWLQTLQNNGATKGYNYGTYLGSRYKNFPNIVWMSGNDFNSWQNQSDDTLVLAVAKGIKSSDTNHIHTVELGGNGSPGISSLDDSNWASIITLNAAYTYSTTYAEVLHAYSQATMPVFMVEANYEFENNTGWDYGSPLILRMQEYWTMLSGATGQLYGNHYTWGFISGWKNNLDTTGSIQMRYVTNLFASRQWQDLVPDQNHTMVTAGYGVFSSTGSLGSNDYLTAARTPDGKLAIAYMPTIRTIIVDMTKLSGTVTARWYDPANGTYTNISGSPFPNSGSWQFTPPGNNSDGNGDWVLVLEAN